MRVFALKTCDTCRKALAEIRAAGLAPEVIDIRSDGIGAEDVAAIVGAFGEAAVNRASTTWRGLDERERQLPVEALIARYPTLLKRPVIERSGSWVQGWTASARAEVLGP